MKDLVPKIEAWAKEKKLDAVVWTDLEPNFKDKQKIELTPESATAYLRKLDDKSRKKAEIYVRNTPLQIDTKIRETLERELGWACADDDVRIQRWSDLKKSMIKRLVKESPDGSYWIVVPQEPATFGHLLAVSWKSSGEHDITDEGLFTDNSHIQNMMRAIHELTLRMKSSLTSNGKADGRKCEKVYVATLCETKDFPFHFHVIPRFEGDKEGFAYLLEKELEEARWMDRETGRNEKVKDGYRRIGSTEVLLDYHKCLMSSDKWVRTNKERDGFVSETLQWARKHTGGLSSYRIKEPRALPVDNRKED
jgi:diadenosine tetraphosphate (Ap4A) HIT family hydrolase